jgi:hypothetical protein
VGKAKFERRGEFIRSKKYVTVIVNRSTELYVFDTSTIFAFTDQEDGAAEVERLVE